MIDIEWWLMNIFIFKPQAFACWAGFGHWNFYDRIEGATFCCFCTRRWAEMKEYNAVWASREGPEPNQEIRKAVWATLSLEERYGPQYLLKQWQVSEQKVREKVKPVVDYWKREKGYSDIIIVSREK